MSEPHEEDRYLDLRALSEYSSLSVRTLRSYVSDPSDPLRSFSIKRKILVRKSDFDSWVRKHRLSPKRVETIVEEVLADVL